MRDNISFHCVLQGQEVDPTPFLTLLPFKVLEYHCVGDIGTKGTSKGLPLKTGYIRFTSQHGNFNEFIYHLHLAKNLIIACEAERRVVHLLLLYENQCNWEFEPETLGMISELKLVLTMSCDKIESELSTDINLTNLHEEL